MAANSSTSIAVIGAGLTGLTAAFRLHEAGHRVRLFERSARTGGSINTVRENGFLVEAGPNTLQFSSPELKLLVRDAGLETAVIEANPLARRRFIVRQGRLVPVPASPPAFFGTSLFGIHSKLSLLTELATRPRVRTTDLSLAALMRSHFTQEIVDYAVNPLIAGIYAGDPEKLSVRYAFPTLWEAERSHGSLLRGLMARARTRKAAGDSRVPAIVSFPKGLQQLTDALATRLPAGSIQLNATVETIIPGRPHRLVWKQNGQSGTDEFAAVVLAVPAGALAQLTFGTLGERPLASLDKIPQPPVTSLFLGYRREQVGHPLNGFGGLVPAVERREILGVLFSSTLFPHRAPEGHVGLTVFVGGMRQPHLARLSLPELQERIRGDLAELLDIKSEPVFSRATLWPAAIPQYVLGYERWLEAMMTVEAEYRGIFIGGNARDGISLPDCVKSGEKLAQKIIALNR